MEEYRHLFYIYNVDTMEIVAIAGGDSNEECEGKAFIYLGMDEYGGTYSDAELDYPENHDQEWL